ncbi:hypothetical protein GDO86_001356, partial [Hymenochirus boettgeri]
NGNDQLATAAAQGKEDLVEELLHRGVPANGLNSLGRSSIQVMKMGNPNIARTLIQWGADPRAQDPRTGTSPAHDAIREGFLDTLQVLLAGGASLYEPLDNYGLRPIDWA